MTDKRLIIGGVSFALFFGVFLLTTLAGNPVNSLHISGQSYGCWASLGILAGMGLGYLKDLIPLMLNKTPEVKP